jgi:hypothetical protein
MAKDKVEVLAQAYEHAADETMKAIAKVSEDGRAKQLQAGKAHPIWLLGHLAFATDTIVNTLCLGGTQELPPTYMQKFAPAVMGGPPITANASDYPDWDELVANYQKVMKQAAAGIRALDDADLPGGAKGNVPPAFGDFFKVLAGTLGHMADHDAYHRGQMAMIAALD